MYKITLADGTIIDNIGLEGSAFSSETPIDPSIFDHNLSPVNIEYVGDPENETIMSIPTGHFENMVFYEIQLIDSEYFTFVLKPIPKSELEIAYLRSRVDYIAMMTDIDL